MPASQGRIFKLIFSNIFNPLPHLPQPLPSSRSSKPLSVVRYFSSLDNDDNNHHKEDERRRNKTHQNPPNPIPNRLMRGEKQINRQSEHSSQYNKPVFRGGNRGRSQSRGDLFSNKFNGDDGDFSGGIKIEDNEGKKMNKSFQSSTLQFLNEESGGEKGEGQLEDSFLDKFKLGVSKKDIPRQTEAAQLPKKEEMSDRTPIAESAVQDADEIFRKMKETGLIPNAVAMLDGLCKDGLVQEAMKLFGLMREKGTIPEVVIYTAVVEGFCKAQKFEDAKRIFRKMQSNGISPNAFSYTVLIQGLYKCKKLDDAVDFCVEMLEASHSPNVATFAGLVDGLCKEKGVEEAKNVIGRLREKGFFVDEKAVREYLDKKAPFSSLVWEAILGKKSSQKSF